jgi:hypothetical protein
MAEGLLQEFGGYLVVQVIAVLRNVHQYLCHYKCQHSYLAKPPYSDSHDNLVSG